MSFFIKLKEAFLCYIFYCSLGSCCLHSEKARCRISFNFSKTWISSRKHSFPSTIAGAAQYTGTVSKMLEHTPLAWKLCWQQLPPELPPIKKHRSL